MIPADFPVTAGSRSVLVTDGGGADDRAAVGAVRTLSSAGYRPVVARSGNWAIAAASRHCARVVRVPPVLAEGYAEAIREEMRRHGYLSLLPSHDAALLVLGSPVGELIDKARLAEAAKRAGLPTPPTKVFATAEELLDAAAGLDYPVVVKAGLKRGSGHPKAARVDDPGGLDRRTAGPIVVQPFIQEPLLAVGGVKWGERLVAAVRQRYLRTWEVDCGEASAAVTLAPDLGAEERLVRLLGDYEGIFQAQFAGSYLLDLNPRIYGSMPLAAAAGANLAAVYCDLLRGEEVEEVRGRPGMAYRWIEGDVRHLLVRARDGRMSWSETLRALRPRRGTAHSTFEPRDPAPGLVRLGFALTRLLRRARR